MLCSYCSGAGYTYGNYRSCYGCGGSGHGAYTNVACMACGGSGRSNERETPTCWQCGGTGQIPDPPSIAPRVVSAPRPSTKAARGPKPAPDPRQREKNSQGFWMLVGAAAGGLAGYEFFPSGLGRDNVWMGVLAAGSTLAYAGYRLHKILSWAAVGAIVLGLIYVIVQGA